MESSISFVKQYLLAITNGAEPQVIDREQAGKHTEFLESVKLVYERGGHDAAIEAMRECAPQDINIHALLNPPRKFIYSINDLDKLPHQKYLLNGVIPEKGLVMMYGQSGVGKSFIAVDQGLHLSLHHTVLYIAAEGQSGYPQRIKAWVAHHKVDPAKLDFHLCVKPINLSDRSEINQLIEDLKLADINPGVIYVDTFSRCIAGADENSSGDMSEVINNCDYLREALETAIVLIHHTGKSNGKERGSSVLRGASDIMLYVKEDDGVITLTCNKAKDQEPFDDRYYKLETYILTADVTTCVVMPSKRQIEIQGNKLSANQWALLEALSLSIFREAGGRTKQLNEASEVYGSSFYKSVNALKNAGYVRQAKKGDPYFITEEGLQLLADRDRDIENQDEL